MVILRDPALMLREQEIFHLNFIKSFNDTYIPPKTPRRERTIVKTGVLNSRILSSLVPSHVITRIIIIIWNAIPEYLPKSCNPLFPWLFGWSFRFFCFGDSCSFIIFTFAHFAISGESGAGFNRKFESNYITDNL